LPPVIEIRRSDGEERAPSRMSLPERYEAVGIWVGKRLEAGPLGLVRPEAHRAGAVSRAAGRGDWWERTPWWWRCADNGR
jgi:hypothetical protein